MTTATVQQHAHSRAPNDIGSIEASAPTADDRRQVEKDFIASFESDSRLLSPSQIIEDPMNQKLGSSSQSLRLDDFELLKTLGTGELCLAKADNIAFLLICPSSKQELSLEYG